MASLREEHGLTQKDMAKRLGLTVSPYNRFEYNQAKWTAERMRTAAEVFGMETSELVKLAEARTDCDDPGGEAWMEAL
nr:helix-turn-helix transcriptional regulator [Nocardia sp.]